MFVNPNEFIKIVSKKIYQGLESKFRIEITNVKSESDITVPVMIISQDEIHYIAPLVQIYMDYTERFDGDINRFCEDLCKKIENFYKYIKNDENITVN